MKNVIVVLMVLFSRNALAESLSSTLYFSSNYIYRGISFSNQGNEYSSSGSPVMQGSIDYLSDSGFGYSLFTGNVDSLNLNTFNYEKDQELDHFLSYSKKFNDEWSVSLNLNYFSVFRNRDTNTLEYAASVTYGTWRLDSAYDPKYSGVDVNMWYTKLSKRVYLTDTTYLLAHVAQVVWSDTQITQMSNYQDYRLGAGFNLEGFSAEIAYTNTMNRQNISTGEVSNKDAAVTISISKTFDLLSKK